MGEARRWQVGASEVELEPEGTLVVRIGAIDVTGAHVRQILEAQLALGAVQRAVLIDARKARSMTREAQDLTASPEMKAYNRCLAILVDSPVSVVIANIFSAVVRPPYPTRLFRGEVEARAWLARAAEGAP